MRRTLITIMGWAICGLALLLHPLKGAVAGVESLQPGSSSQGGLQEEWSPAHPWPFTFPPADAYRLLAPEYLPKGLLSPSRSPGTRPPDYTPMLLTLSRSRHLLPPELRAPLESLMGRGDQGEATTGPPDHKIKTAPRALERGRPYSAGYFESDIYPLRVHYRSRFTSERARQTLGFAEISYGRILEMGFDAPVPDGGLGGSEGLDIYLVGEIRSGGGGLHRSHRGRL